MVFVFFMQSSLSEGVRLSKCVMQLRDCSRTQAEQFIAAGFVRVGGMVLVMALAIFLPMWNLIQVFKQG